MPEPDAGAVMKLQIVALRGKDRGRFGWVLYTDEVLVQCRKTFPSKEAAEADAADFQKGGGAVH
jgi:hypothetical protein